MSDQWLTKADQEAPSEPPIGPDSTIVQIKDFVDSTVPVLDVVLSILGIAKVFANLLEDPLGAIVDKLEQQMLSYIKDTGGLYISTDFGIPAGQSFQFSRVAAAFNKAAETHPLTAGRGDGAQTSWQAAQQRYDLIVKSIEPFKGISSFKNEYYRRIINKEFSKRPIAYNSTVFGIFITGSIGLEFLKGLFQIIMLLIKLISGVQSSDPKVNSFDALYEMDLDWRINPRVTYDQAITYEKDPLNVGFFLDLDLLTGWSNKVALVIYTREQGFQTYKKDGDTIVPDKVLYYLEEGDQKRIAFDDKGALKTDIVVSNLKNIEVNLSPGGETLVADAKFQAYVPVSTFFPVGEVSVNYENLFNLKYPNFDGNKITLVENTSGEVYARLYFLESKVYSEPVVVRKVKTVPDYEKLFDLFLKSLVLVHDTYEANKQAILAPQPKLSSTLIRAKNLHDRLPEDVFYHIGLFKKFGDGRYLRYRNFMRNYPYIKNLFDFTKSKPYSEIESKLGDKVHFFDVNAMKFTKENTTLENEDRYQFLDSIIINKVPLTSQPDNTSDPWGKFLPSDAAFLKNFYIFVIETLKKIAEWLKGFGSGLVKTIENLEKIVKSLKELAQTISDLIALIVEIINTFLQFTGSINILILNASSTQELAEKLLASSMPDNPNSESDYFLGAGVVATTGLPSILNDFIAVGLKALGADPDFTGLQTTVSPAADLEVEL